MLDEAGVLINQRESKYDTELLLAHAGCELGTALHCAAWGNTLHCMRVLLERGIDANIMRGRTARDQAMETGHDDAVALLDRWKNA